MELALKGVFCTRLGSKRPLRRARFVLTEVRWLCHTYELPCVLQCLTPAIVLHSFLRLVGNKLRNGEVDELFSDVGEYHGFIHTAGICLVSNRGGLGTSNFSEALWRRGGKGRRACNYISRIWIPLPIIPCGSPSIELSDFHQSARSGNEREQKLKNTWKYAPRLMASLLISSQPISIAYSCKLIANQIADQQTEVPVTSYNVNRFTFLFIPRFRENGHVQPIAKKGDSCIMADI